MISGELNKELAKIFANTKDSGLLIICLILNWYKSSYNMGSPIEGGDRMILQATCLLHLGGTGLGMMSLINSATQCLNITVKDLLSQLYYDSTEKSIKRVLALTNTWADQDKKNPHLNQLFPWCRLVHQDFHSGISASENNVLSYALTLIVDHTLGNALSNARSALWVKNMPERARRLGRDLGNTYIKTHDLIDQQPLHPDAVAIIRTTHEDEADDLIEAEEGDDDSIPSIPPAKNP